MADFLLFLADAPLGTLGQTGHQAIVGDREVKASSCKTGYLVGLEREKYAIRGKGWRGQKYPKSIVDVFFLKKVRLLIMNHSQKTHRLRGK